MSQHPAVELHDSLAGQWERKYEKPSFARRRQLIASCLDGLNLDGQHWLDAGCGTGSLARLLAQKGCRVTGIDAAPAMLAAAQSAAAAEGLGHALSFQQVETVELLPFADASFDGVLCSSVLEYLDHPEACLSEFARVLRPGGLLLLTAPNRCSLLRRMLHGILSISRWAGRPWPRYLLLSKNEYDRAGLAGALGRYALEVTQIIPFGGRGPLWLQRRTRFGPLLLALARKVG
jgi:2-polyprenyl-6-hydroxyphenyl methylase/3-demethylubiquinone-9 3-methyltransferase